MGSASREALNAAKASLSGRLGKSAGSELLSAAAQIGFDGKTVIHPDQIEPALTAFSPSAPDIEQARRVRLRLGAVAAAVVGDEDAPVLVDVDEHVGAREHALRAADLDRPAAADGLGVAAERDVLCDVDRALRAERESERGTRLGCRGQRPSAGEVQLVDGGGVGHDRLGGDRVCLDAVRLVDAALRACGGRDGL